MVGRRVLSAFLAMALLSACERTPTLVRAQRDVTVYAVISPSGTASPADSGLYALVALQEGPFDGRYLTATSFSMERVSDGGAFAWQWVGREGSLPATINNGFSMGDGNYRLALSAAPGSLARNDLQPGDSVALTITLSDRVVVGRIRVPSLPTPTLLTAGDSVVAVWPRDAHAGVYLVESESENRFFSFQSDTSVRLALDRPADQRPATIYLRVFALDSAYTRYLQNLSLTSAGLSGALGLFGAVTVDSVEIPAGLFPSSRAP